MTASWRAPRRGQQAAYSGCRTARTCRVTAAPAQAVCTNAACRWLLRAAGVSPPVVGLLASLLAALGWLGCRSAFDRPIQPHALWRQHLQAPLRRHCEAVNIKAATRIFGQAHNGRWSRHDPQPGAISDPIEVSMPVHQHHLAGAGFETTNEPIAVDQRRADALGESLGRSRIFDQMMMQSDDPAGLWVLRTRDLDALGLLDRDHAERVRKRKMRVGIRIQQYDSQSVVAIGRQHQWEDASPQLCQF